jgi:hypothetical protein
VRDDYSAIKENKSVSDEQEERKFRHVLPGIVVTGSSMAAEVAECGY